MYIFAKFIEYTKKIYSEVHLVTDNAGADTFKNMGFTSIDTVLENIPNHKEIKNHIWCYGKLYGINYIANKNEPFFHLDYDFFLLDKIPNDILSAEVVFQSKEDALLEFYNKNFFIQNCKNKYLNKNLDFNNLNYAYNCGIVGGQNYTFFKKYTEFSMKMIQDLENKDFWFTNYKKFPNFFEFTKSILAEQYYAALYAEEMNISPTFFWDTTNYKPSKAIFFKQRRALHLYGDYKTAYLLAQKRLIQITSGRDPIYIPVYKKDSIN